MEVVNISSGSLFCGFYHTFILCKDGLYAFGNNKYGKLGLGNTTNQITPQKTTFTYVSCGRDHTLIFSKDGLYSVGNNSSGQLGLGHTSDQLNPQKIMSFTQVISVSCGFYHTFVLCKDGLYTFGGNEFGQLGLGNNSNQLLPQKTIFTPSQILSVSCGFYHTLVHCKDGLYAFGNNQYGQLGIGNIIDQSIPQKILFFQPKNKIISVSCGGYFTFVHCKDGLYSFGDNRVGQLGLGNNTNYSIPQKIHFFSQRQVISISCGGLYMFVLCKDGLFAFGCNTHGQLGLGHTNDQSTPQKTIFSPSEIIYFSCGREHTFVLCEDGLYAFGENSFGQLGLGNTTKQLNPQKAPFLSKKDSQNEFAKYLFSNKDDSDLLIRNEKFHKAFLSIKCPQILQTETQSMLETMNEDTFKQMMFWIYTNTFQNGQIEIPLTSEKIENYKVFELLLNEKQYADCVIKVNEIKTFYLHSFILSPKWTYFKNEMKNKKKITMDLPTKTLETVIEYFYIGLKTISEHDASWILYQADKFDLSVNQDLIQLCENTARKSNINEWKNKISQAIELKKAKPIELISQLVDLQIQFQEQTQNIEQQAQDMNEIKLLCQLQTQEINDLKIVLQQMQSPQKKKR